MKEVIEAINNTFGELGNLYMRIAILILLILGLYCLITVLRRNALKKKLKEINYFTEVEQKLLPLFGTSNLNNVLNKSAKLVKNYSDSKTFDYLMKYFGFQMNDETLTDLRELLNIVKQAESVEKSKLWYRGVLSYYLPKFTMHYSSPKGRSTSSYTVKLDSSTIIWLGKSANTLMKSQKGKKLERRKMTLELREAILRRDNWTCQCCGNSVFKEPNLALEVDHIIPVSKGGKTEPNNLQTLCWKCNRRKSDNIVINHES